jgi:cytochrome c peroxidase
MERLDRRIALLVISFGLAGYLACSGSDGPTTVDGTSGWPAPDPLVIDAPRFPVMSVPPDNPTTVQGVALGRQLFYDPILSADSTQACASCHQIERAFSDTLRFSVGIDGRPGGRTAPALTNAGWLTSAFWDGRAATLEDQAFEPVVNPDEMHEDWDDVVAKLQATPRYPELFGRAFGSDIITRELVVKAIGQFERTFVSNQTKYDRWLETRDPVAAGFTAAQDRGRLLFNTEAGDCFHCHPPNALLTDNAFHNTGLDSPFVDRGVGEITLDPNDFGKFKTPSLRNVALSPPYMHDGRFQTLEEVVNHYNSGGFSTPTIDPLLRKRGVGLGLTPGQVSDIVAFLQTMTDTAFVNNAALSNPFE